MERKDTRFITKTGIIIFALIVAAVIYQRQLNLNNRLDDMENEIDIQQVEIDDLKEQIEFYAVAQDLIEID